MTDPLTTVSSSFDLLDDFSLNNLDDASIISFFDSFEEREFDKDGEVNSKLFESKTYNQQNDTSPSTLKRKTTSIENTQIKKSASGVSVVSNSSGETTKLSKRKAENTFRNIPRNLITFCDQLVNYLGTNDLDGLRDLIYNNLEDNATIFMNKSEEKIGKNAIYSMFADCIGTSPDRVYIKVRPDKYIVKDDLHAISCAYSGHGTMSLMFCQNPQQYECISKMRDNFAEETKGFTQNEFFSVITESTMYFVLNSDLTKIQKILFACTMKSAQKYSNNSIK
jgi:hypothetical protein